MMDIKKAGWLSKKVLLISLFVIVTACGEGMSDKALMGRAKEYIEARDLNAATLELKNILRNDVNNAEARYLLGKINLELGDMKTAQKEMRRALDGGWDEAVVQVSLAETLFRQGYFQKVLDDVPVKDSYPDEVKADLIGFWALSEASMGKWSEAEQTIKAGEVIAGDSVWLLQSKIRLELYRKSLQTAMRLLEDGLKVHPRSQDLWLLSAGLAEENGELTKAIQALQSAIDLDPPKNITAWGRQARLAQVQILLKQQEFVKAKAVIEPVLKIYPGDPLANYLGAVAAFKQGEYDLTEERLLSTLKVEPEHRASLLLFGALDYARGDYQKAAYHLEKAAALQPDDVGAQTLLGKTYLMLGQYDEAENRLKFASSKRGDDAELLVLLGISKLQGGSKVGIQELEKAAAAEPTNAAIRGELARAYMVTGETGLAIKELESVLEGDTQHYKTEVMLLLAYLAANDFDKALALAINLSEKLPDKASPYNLAGLAYEGKKDFSSAKNSYDRALALQPDNITAMLNLARLDLRDGNVEIARNRYNSVLKIRPDNAAAMVALAKLSAQEGNVEETLELLEKARKADETALKPRLVLSKYYLDKGMAEKALGYAKEASKVAPLNPLSILAVGRAQIGTGEPAAVQTLNKLVERLPDSPEAHYYYAQAQARFGGIAAARQSLQSALVLKPDYELALRALGKLELADGKTDEALKISQKLIKVLPESVAGYALEGDVLVSMGKMKDALRAYRSGLAYANDGEIVIKISRVERGVGNSVASYDVLNKWLEQHAEDQAVRFMLATSYLADGKKDIAIGQYEQLLKKQPDNPSVLNDLAWLYYERGEQGALEMAEKAYHLAPDSAAIQDTYGWILVQSGRLESGIIALEQAASNAPDSLDIRYHLAAALAKAGEKARAREELGLVLQSDKVFSERASAEALHKELK